MSFCSGLLEGAATYLFAGEWYGDVGFNITTDVESSRTLDVSKTNKVNAAQATF
jgi:hypothetical protein